MPVFLSPKIHTHEKKVTELITPSVHKLVLDVHFHTHSDHITFLDTFVFVDGNMARREYIHLHVVVAQYKNLIFMSNVGLYIVVLLSTRACHVDKWHTP
jgi:hypothetical protein